MKIITQKRTYMPAATMSDIYVADRHFYGLEDIGRPPGVKIPGETCVPEGLYEARVTYSPRFGRKTVELTSPGLRGIKRHGVEFEGLRVHRGNSVDDTEGCVIIGSATNNTDRVWLCGPAEEALLEYMGDDVCYWVITS